MSDYRRALFPGGCYFFTVVTYQRQPLFSCPDNIAHLRAAFKKIKKQRPFCIDGIVILPDHIHTLWRLPEGDDDFSGRWRELKKLTSKEINKQSNERNERHVWQRRFYEHVIRGETDWQRHMDYIHYNPVKHGLVERVVDWPWSSFHHGVQKGRYEVDWGARVSQTLLSMEFE